MEAATGVFVTLAIIGLISLIVYGWTRSYEQGYEQGSYDQRQKWCNDRKSEEFIEKMINKIKKESK